MSKSAALMLTLSLLLSGCVTTGDTARKVDPIQARDSYIQLGLGYLQKGETERAKKPLSEALAIDPKSASANMKRRKSISALRLALSQMMREF